MEGACDRNSTQVASEFVGHEAPLAELEPICTLGFIALLSTKNNREDSQTVNERQNKLTPIHQCILQGESQIHF